jgi:Asp-tRNA(Asn)/Glu-tRNA(Gln) amidotransferase C subunit
VTRFERWLRRARCGEFDSVRGTDGRIRAGVWDRVCVPGFDEKDGQHTEFTVATLGEMVDNFVERGDQIPLDYNHQSNYSHVNGQPAPALAFYGALAIVAGGSVTKLGCARGVSASGTEPGLDLTREGLWAYRCEVTELGQTLLPNFKYVSPTFMSNGTKRDGTEIGYVLAAVAATNTPWQGETQITFAQAQRHDDVTATPSGTPEHAATHTEDCSPAGSAPAQKEARMAKFQKYAKFAGAAEGADDAAIKTGMATRLAKLAQEAMEEEAFQYEEEAAKLEEMASEMSAFEGDDDAKSFAAKMSKMASSFKRMSKFDADGDKDDDKPAKMEDAGAKAQMAAMQATIASLGKRVATFEHAEADRAKAAERDREKKFEQLADAAVKGGYPEENRADLILFARTNYDAAARTVAAFLPKSGGPAHLFDRVSGQGAPLGAPAGHGAREFSAPAKPRETKTPFGKFVEMDGAFADKVNEIAESKDPSVMAKVDKLLPAPHRPVMFHRLLAAERVVRAEHPDLAAQAE